MPTQLQQISQRMERLTLKELRILSDNVQKRLEHETNLATSGSSCRLLSLPRELRNLIYHFTAFYHIRDIDRQLLSEFHDALYSGRLLSARYFENGVWHEATSDAMVEELLKCQDRMVVDFGGRLLGTHRDQAERLAEFFSNNIDRSAQVGVLELAGTDGHSCISLAIARSMIRAHTASVELL